MKLHLGCGRQYMEGYVNVDYPPSEHSVQVDLKADLFHDLLTLEYPPNTIEEIRLHHVFEHFSRPDALALLCRWRDWLEPCGKLRIETPDLIASARLLVSPWWSYGDKQEVVRHLFGSHESHWAVHWDGWSPERFVRTLSALGFEQISTRTEKWGRLRNVEVLAQKGAARLGLSEYREAVRDLLRASTIKPEVKGKGGVELTGSEAEMLKVWMQMWEKAYVYSMAPSDRPPVPLAD